MPPAEEVPQCRGAGGRLHHRKGAHFQGIFLQSLTELIFIRKISAGEPELGPEPEPQLLP